jgi:hypothetical protein
VPPVAPVKLVAFAAVTAIVSAAPNPPPAEAPPASAPPEPPDPDTTLALGNGTELVLALTPTEYDEPPTMALELRRENKVVLRREGWNTITHFDVKKLSLCENWYTQVRRESLGTVDAVHVSLICHAGEDFITNKEVAVLIKPDTLETIWAGLADTSENTMDSCLTRRRVQFRMIPPKTLEKTIVDETVWYDQNLDEDTKARFKKGCKVGTKRHVERLKLP